MCCHQGNPAPVVHADADAAICCAKLFKQCLLFTCCCWCCPQSCLPGMESQAGLAAASSLLKGDLLPAARHPVHRHHGNAACFALTCLCPCAACCACSVFAWWHAHAWITVPLTACAPQPARSCLQASATKFATPQVLLLAPHRTTYKLCAALPCWLILPKATKHLSTHKQSPVLTASGAELAHLLGAVHRLPALRRLQALRRHQGRHSSCLPCSPLHCVL